MKITGNIKGMSGGNYAKQTVEVFVVRDFITNDNELIHSASTDEFGNFSLNFKIAQTEIGFIRLGKVERILFFEPGNNYYIPIRAELKKLAASNGFFAKDVLQAYIKNKSAADINYWIDSLDYTCSNFLANNPQKRKSYKSIKSFCDSITNAFEQVDKPFFKSYLTYKVAELQMFVLRTFRNDFIKFHFTPNKNYASNVQAMHVFNSFFKGNLQQNILSNDKSSFHRALLTNNLDKMLIDIHPSTADNKELNELILMKGLLEISDLYYYRKSKLTDVLDNIIKTTSHPLHQKIARNIKGKISHLEVGSKAPDFDISAAGRNIKLSDYRGKYLYLSFFRGWDLNFKKELETIHYLRKRYGDDLEVLCISSDIDLKTFTEFKASVDEANFIVHYGFQPSLLSDYRVPDFRMQETHYWQTPSIYFLIDPQGNIVYNPAKPPSKGFEYDLRLLIGK